MVSKFRVIDDYDKRRETNICRIHARTVVYKDLPRLVRRIRVHTPKGVQFEVRFVPWLQRTLVFPVSFFHAGASTGLPLCVVVVENVFRGTGAGV